MVCRRCGAGIPDALLCARDRQGGTPAQAAAPGAGGFYLATGQVGGFPEPPGLEAYRQAHPAQEMEMYIPEAPPVDPDAPPLEYEIIEVE